jgi:hypothetical protein
MTLPPVAFDYSPNVRVFMERFASDKQIHPDGEEKLDL